MRSRQWMLATTACVVACWAPNSTSRVSMLGKVVDAQGEPIVGLQVNSVEARDVTDEAGRFAVNFKAPDQWVYLQHDGLWLQRTYDASDDGTLVRLQVPERASRAVMCRGLEAPCEAELWWDIEPLWAARVRVACDPNGPAAEAPVVAMPFGPPDRATCRTDVAAPAQPLMAFADVDPQLCGAHPMRKIAEGSG